jgi:hypothetical protein
LRALITLLLVAAGCAPTETGNPFRAELGIDAHSSDPRRVAVREPQGGDVVNEAWLGLGPIGFYTLCDELAGDLPALGVADHGVAGANFQSARLVTATYCRVGVPFVTATAPLPAGAPEELLGKSILLSGELADGTAFLLVSSFTGEVDVRGLGAGFELDRDRRTLFLGFDVATWLSGADFATAEREADGSVLVNESRNRPLLDAFEADLAGGIELYRDPNGDGVPDEVGADLIAVGR